MMVKNKLYLPNMFLVLLNLFNKVTIKTILHSAFNVYNLKFILDLSLLLFTNRFTKHRETKN